MNALKDTIKINRFLCSSWKCFSYSSMTKVNNRQRQAFLQSTKNDNSWQADSIELHEHFKRSASTSSSTHWAKTPIFVRKFNFGETSYLNFCSKVTKYIMAKSDRNQFGSRILWTKIDICPSV